MSAIYLILLSVVLYSVGAILRKQISTIDDTLNYIFTVLFQILGGVFVIIFSVLMGFGGEYSQFIPTIDAYILIKIIAGAILWFSATFLSMKALHTVSASKYSVIETLSPVLSIVLALLFLGEHFVQQQFFGVILIFISVFLVMYDKKTKLTTFSKGELIAIASTIFSGLALVNDKGIYLRAPLSPTLATLFILPGLLAILAQPKELKKLKLIRKNFGVIKQLLIMSAIWSVAAIFYYKAIVLSQSISLVVSVSQLSVILTVLLGLIFLKETTNWRKKLLAAVISVVGLILVSL
ncbi:DMT family transporter [Candidatus Woesebacteria bacterium]|nr:DMT family transporter [Candidatus Woesebacteria bacterium]